MPDQFSSGVSEELSEVGEDFGVVAAQCTVGSWIGSWNRKGMPVEKPVESGIVPMLVSWFDHCTMVTADVSIRGSGMKGMWELSVFFLELFCKSKIISK